MLDTPIISIIVITYNSAKYVIETLESAKAQTFKNIELIISDDGSSDNTAVLCKNWLKENNHFFRNTKFITVEKNIGLPSNCNRGIMLSTGEWIKLIAGDDILQKDCLNLNINFAIKNNKQFVISNVEYFNERGILSGYGSHKEIKNFFSKKGPAAKLKSFMRNSVFLNSPTYFYNRKVYDLNDGFDEDFKVLEDSPFIIKTLLNNVDIIFLHSKTVKYRINSVSITSKAGDYIKKDLNLFYTKYKKKYFETSNDINFFYHQLIKFEILMKNKGLGRSLFFKIYYKSTSIFRRIA